ncbi:MAG: hypothetical protein JO146_07940 [Candidatus Eremiobacteraeota bacterium]|nr:hypothetical protein [Candidatus Eremiobacteraeota bacterium]
MRRSRESGQVMPLIALALAVLMGFGGMGVDVGYWEYVQREQQTATDAAALGAAQELADSGCTNWSVATAGADADAARNGFAGGANVTINVQTPPQNGPYAGDACAAYVQISSKHVALFFTRLFGLAAGQSETTEATAKAGGLGNGCIYMLAPNQNTNFHGANVVAPSCSIYVNGTANFNAGNANAAFIGEANYAGSNNGGTFGGASPVSMLPIEDPCAEIPGCAYLAANPPPISPCNGSYAGGSVLTPGCYSNLSLNKATVTLSPGTYVLSGSSNFNQASITGTGVTIYIPAGATTNFNNVNSMSITPPASGNYAGVSFYQVPGNSNGVNFNGSSINIGGLIYGPSASMNYNGSFGQYTVLVAAYANLNNSTGEDFGPPVGGRYLVSKAVVVE